MSAAVEAVMIKEGVKVKEESWQEVLRRLDRITEEVVALRDLVEQLAAEEPVMIPLPDGTERPFHPIRSVSRETAESIRRAALLVRERKDWTREMHVEHGRQVMEQARADAIARGIAIDDEREAAIGD